MQHSLGNVNPKSDNDMGLPGRLFVQKTNLSSTLGVLGFVHCFYKCSRFKGSRL